VKCALSLHIWLDAEHSSAIRKRVAEMRAELHGDGFFTALQDYDWADEVLHVQIGRRWLPPRAEVDRIYDGTTKRLTERSKLYADRFRSTNSEWWPAFVERARAAPSAAG
jgi:hypothetical protein